LNREGSVDVQFDAGIEPIGTVNSMALQSDGKIIIGGQFTKVRGFQRNHIARLNPDGTVDETFYPGTGANYDVAVLALRPDGKVAIAGAFSLVNGLTRNALALLNGDILVEEVKLVNPVINGNRFLVVVPTMAGRTYVLQGKDSLNDLSWTDVSSGAGGGADMTLSDPGPTGPQRFYRVRIE
jgi:hypothetical protein